MMFHSEVPELEVTDAELLERAQAGDEQALTLLFSRHAPRLYELAAMMIGQTSDAQDVMQETLLAIWRQLGRFEARSSFRTWAIGILIRQAARHRRKLATRRMMSWFYPQVMMPRLARVWTLPPLTTLRHRSKLGWI
ncbi:MAG: RNA polymerase sigma factor [Phycisphaerales bacterium]|nr:RNA polymerase sigma factor [Phycisphaerales bacterium]